MKERATIILAEDDEGHASLITRNLKKALDSVEIIRFKNGQQTMDFLLGEDHERRIQSGRFYIVLLDIRLPKIDGVEVLRRMKNEPDLAGIPVIVLSTTEDPAQVKECHELGCSLYINKPVDYNKFVETIKQLGKFIMSMEAPPLEQAPDD
ncbi:MAG: response regulator [Dehalococcoidia bacterium]